LQPLKAASQAEPAEPFLATEDAAVAKVASQAEPLRRTAVAQAKSINSMNFAVLVKLIKSLCNYCPINESRTGQIIRASQVWELVLIEFKKFERTHALN